jgi:two-component system, NtrC family, response regulator AtoC
VKPVDVRPVVLIVDEPGVPASVKAILDGECEVLQVADGPAALELVKTRRVDLCLLDSRLPGTEGITMLERLKRLDAALEVVLLTAARTAVEVTKLGAHDSVTKPFGVDDLRAVVRRALERRALPRAVTDLQDELACHDGLDELVGRSAAIRSIYAVIRQIAGTSATVMITGESGTGKELIARAIHRRGPRRDRPFVTVNCGALPPELMESELFGHERGAFTGAHARKLGKFEIAHTGTLFLDEVATLRVDLQPKLLRVLQEREIERVGGTRSVKVDVRFIAATNGDLSRAIAHGQFREDLFYRLHVVPIAVPPLRERREDVPLLVGHFLRKYAKRFGKTVTDVSAGAIERLQHYSWPGNVRELENIIERAVALATDSVIQLADIPLNRTLVPRRTAWDDRLSFREALQEFERQLILRALDQANGNQTVAARRLGMHRNTLATKLARLGLRAGDGVGGTCRGRRLHPSAAGGTTPRDNQPTRSGDAL